MTVILSFSVLAANVLIAAESGGDAGIGRPA
jgi:hypothetical protein